MMLVASLRLLILSVTSIAIFAGANTLGIIISTTLFAMDNNSANKDISSPSSSTNETKPKQPNRLKNIDFLDCHHHFYDTKQNTFQKFLGRFNPQATYLPDDYYRDVIESINNCESKSLAMKQFKHIGSVHVEAIPDDGISEVQWVESLSSSSTVKAIVASCNLADENVDATLQSLKDTSSKVKGIRWILDYVGDIDQPGNEATHVATLRNNGIDYLRDTTNIASDGQSSCSEREETIINPKFEHGFSLLEKHGLTFDLQCAPEQLPAAAELCARYPNIPVVIDHLGKPMQILGKDNSHMVPDSEKLQEWRRGMEAMAALPNVYVKISMLGWIIPGWITTARRVDIVRKLCQETVELFGPERCMVSTNWWKDGATSDSDGLSKIGPSAVDFLEYMIEFFVGLTMEEQQRVFGGTAKEFYKIP